MLDAGRGAERPASPVRFDHSWMCDKSLAAPVAAEGVTRIDVFPNVE